MLAGLLVLTLVGCSLAQGTVDPSLVETVFGPQSSNPDPSVLECTNDKGETGICVDIPLCNTDHGYGKVQMRATLGDCSSYLEICCTPAEVLKAPLVPLPPALKEGCGLHQPQGVGFEIEGHTDGEAQFGEFPWMVVIMKKLEKQNKTYNQYVCGGSLIHPSVVVTAAHSITPDLANDLSHLVARAGEWDAQTAREMLRHQNRPIRSIVKHEEHLPSAVFNDVALLFLDEPMDLSPHIGVICLPPPGEYPPPANCFASGWGKDRFDEAGRYQTILKKIELPIVSKSNCEMSLRKTRLGLSFHLHKSFTCAGGIAGQDTCTGDGGSPLACPISDKVGRYMLAGIVSWGMGCGDEGIPGVYSNVPYLRQWIDSKLMLNGIDMSPFRA